MNDDSGRPHFVVKFHVVMSLEQSLTIFVTHFVKYLRLVSRGKQSFFWGGGWGGRDLPWEGDEKLAKMFTGGRKIERGGAEKLKEKFRHTV